MTLRDVSREQVTELATGRSSSLFDPDIHSRKSELEDRLRGARVLVIGGAGSVGAATVAELVRYDVDAVHVVDLNENGLVELVRDLRARADRLRARELRTLPLDFGSPTMERYLRDQQSFDLVLNFAALKHVRSEKDPYSLLHMLDTNVVKAVRLLRWLETRGGTQQYFCVSTDKAANPVSLMGASKRLMEGVIFSRQRASGLTISSTRFANVAFSQGSLLEGWLHRMQKRQPLSVPRDTRRYFLSHKEAGQLCLLAAICGPPGHVLVPQLDAERHLRELEGIARALLSHVGLTPRTYTVEEGARAAVESDLEQGAYPLLVTRLDTAGEKPYEEFFATGERPVAVGMPNVLGVAAATPAPERLQEFLDWIQPILEGHAATPKKSEIVSAIQRVVPELRHANADKVLDDRM